MAGRDAAVDLAIFGGIPLFSQPVTTGQLANRDPDAFFGLMAGAFERRWLTNQGPLVADLESRLRDLHGATHAVTFSNACFALVLALRTLAKPGARKVMMPSLTFRGLPHLVRWAGLEPLYCEVDPVHHTLDPVMLARVIDCDVAAILAVDNINALCDIAGIEAVARSAGVPLVMDSVYGIGGRYGDDPVGSRGNAAVFSLHATKLINGFEGGYLTTNDDALAASLRRQRTFGYGANGVPLELGMNAKLNEIHAAQALSNLAHLDRIVADNRARFAAYREAFAAIHWVEFADYSRAPGTDSLVLLQVKPEAPYARDDLVRILRAENALARPYYSPPLHRAETSFHLPVTDRVAREFIQMPGGDHMAIEDVWRLGRLFVDLDRWQGAILDRLRDGSR